MNRAFGVVVAALLGLTAACGDDDPSPTPTRGPAPDPIVLEHDTRITVRDGGRVDAEPLPPGNTFADPAVSPDGKRRVVSTDGRAVIETGGAAPIVIADSAPEWTRPHWSPDSTRLMFVAGEETIDLYVVAADGSGKTLLAEGGTGGAVYPLTWSPDGKRLAYATLPTDGDGIMSAMYVANADGTAASMIGIFVSPQGDAGWDQPAFSPDGSKIVAFGATTAAGLPLRIFDTAGGPPVDIEVANALKFSWSPNGASIAIETYDTVTQQSRIVIANAATGATRPLTEGSWPRWSPGRDRIAYKRQLASNEFEVRTTEVNGEGDHAVGQPGYYRWTELDWSDDGSDLSFTRPAFGPAHLYRVDLGVGTAERLGGPMGAAGAPPQSVFVSPDGTQAVYSEREFDPAGGWFLRATAEGGDARKIAGTGFPFASVAWAADGPTLSIGDNIYRPGATEPLALDVPFVFRTSFSPDASKIAALANDGLWIAGGDGANPRRIVEAHQDRAIVQQVDWSPDGERLTYTVTVTNPAAPVQAASYVTDLEGNATELPPSGLFAGLARWSPDGDRLAQVREASPSKSSREIWTMSPDGTDERLLHTFDASCCDTLHWSPDGSQIAATHLNELWLIDATTGEAHRAVTTGGGCTMTLAGWTNDGALYVYPACHGGI